MVDNNNPDSVDGIYLQRKLRFVLSSWSATAKKRIKFLESRVHNIPRIQDSLPFFFSFSNVRKSRLILDRLQKFVSSVLVWFKERNFFFFEETKYIF